MRRGTVTSDLPRIRHTCIDSLVGRATAAGRGTGVIGRANRSRTRGPDRLTREEMAAGPTEGLMHLTISQDQSSGSQFFREKLAALSKPFGEVDTALVNYIPTPDGYILKTLRANTKLLKYHYHTEVVLYIVRRVIVHLSRLIRHQIGTRRAYQMRTRRKRLLLTHRDQKRPSSNHAEIIGVYCRSQATQMILNQLPLALPRSTSIQKKTC